MNNKTVQGIVAFVLVLGGAFAHELAEGILMELEFVARFIIYLAYAIMTGVVIKLIDETKEE